MCPKELAVLVTTVPLSPITKSEKMYMLHFKAFGVPYMLGCLTSSCYYGCTTGVVLGSGVCMIYVALH